VKNWMMSLVGNWKKIARAESKLRAIKMNMIRDQFGSYLPRKKINEILIQDLKKELDVLSGLKFKQKHRNTNINRYEKINDDEKIRKTTTKKKSKN
jgi:hypothetical protein